MDFLRISYTHSTCHSVPVSHFFALFVLLKNMIYEATQPVLPAVPSPEWSFEISRLKSCICKLLTHSQV